MHSALTGAGKIRRYENTFKFEGHVLRWFDGSVGRMPMPASESVLPNSVRKPWVSWQ
jgi:hypothetical protein